MFPELEWPNIEQVPGDQLEFRLEFRGVQVRYRVALEPPRRPNDGLLYLYGHWPSEDLVALQLLEVEVIVY
jgi:hypothetical protein